MCGPVCVIVSRLKEAELASEEALGLLDEANGQSAKLLQAASVREMTPAMVAMPTPTSGTSGKEGDTKKGSPSEGVRHR